VRRIGGVQRNRLGRIWDDSIRGHEQRIAHCKSSNRVRPSSLRQMRPQDDGSPIHPLCTSASDPANRSAFSVHQTVTMPFPYRSSNGAPCGLRQSASHYDPPISPTYASRIYRSLALSDETVQPMIYYCPEITGSADS
jgi:hypothetical protein